MKKDFYVEILEQTLLPFIHTTFPDAHKLVQDNDAKHTSVYARTWTEENGVVWWKTPPESPNINPIENLWQELKEYIGREVKPRVKQEPVHGIFSFWQTVDVAKCNKYINHLHKVLPKIIGCATGYLLSLCTVYMHIYCHACMCIQYVYRMSDEVASHFCIFLYRSLLHAPLSASTQLFHTASNFVSSFQ